MTLEVHGLHVRYGPVAAVQGVDLSVGPGEVVALLGVNGAGKTSTLNAIVGMVPVNAGTVLLDGTDITGTAPEALVQRGLVMCPEGRRIFPRLTVEENLRVAGGFVSRGKFDGRLRKAIELFPMLGGRLNALGGQLSGGQQQQLAIARALVRRPRVLLLDEPSLGLAPKLVSEVFELIARLATGEMSILLVEQNAERALELADRGYVLQGGRVALQGTPERLRAADIESAYLGMPIEAGA